MTTIPSPQGPYVVYTLQVGPEVPESPFKPEEFKANELYQASRAAHAATNHHSEGAYGVLVACGGKAFTVAADGSLKPCTLQPVEPLQVFELELVASRGPNCVAIHPVTLPGNTNDIGRVTEWLTFHTALDDWIHRVVRDARGVVFELKDDRLVPSLVIIP
jgi:hypothetical protein